MQFGLRKKRKGISVTMPDGADYVIDAILH